MSIAETTELVPVFSPLLRRYTLEEFWALPEPEDRTHYDLIGGNLFMVPPPDPPHGSVVSRLTKSLLAFLTGNNIAGNVYYPREAIYTEDTYIEPDLMYVSSQLEVKMAGRRTSADIVFEILSKSTAIYDKTNKADTYLALGVAELWLLDADAKTIEIRNAVIRKGSLAWEIRRYRAGASASSLVLTGWQVSIDDTFAGL
jgi:Uma2 family endonuclease